MKNIICLLTALIVLTAGCGRKEQKEQKITIQVEQNIPPFPKDAGLMQDKEEPGKDNLRRENLKDIVDALGKMKPEVKNAIDNDETAKRLIAGGGIIKLSAHLERAHSDLIEKISELTGLNKKQAALQLSKHLIRRTMIDKNPQSKASK